MLPFLPIDSVRHSQRGGWRVNRNICWESWYLPYPSLPVSPFKNPSNMFREDFCWWNVWLLSNGHFCHEVELPVIILIITKKTYSDWENPPNPAYLPADNATAKKGGFCKTLGINMMRKLVKQVVWVQKCNFDIFNVNLKKINYECDQKQIVCIKSPKFAFHLFFHHILSPMRD